MDNDKNYLKLDIPIKYYYSNNPFLTFTDIEKSLISEFISETKKYIRGERKQVNLIESIQKEKSAQSLLNYSIN